MHTERIICAGFGGQGVMSLGKLLACGAMLDGRQVTWMPSYGPEMRGGTAYCAVVVSDRPVGSPIVVSKATSLIVMNQPSLDRFEQSVIPGGLILLNSSLIDRKVRRDDVQVHSLEATTLAAQGGSPQAANMIMLGALCGISTFPLAVKDIKSVLEQVFPASKLEMNHEALDMGVKLVTEYEN